MPNFDDMIGCFNFNTVESSTFKLVCKTVKRPLLPAKKTNRVEILGTSGVYDFDGEEYSLRTITMKIQYIGASYEELRIRARQIAAWLSTKTWAKLIINDEPDKYYLAKVTDEIDLESLWESGTADITFDCQPFAYSLVASSFTFTTTGVKSYGFSNPGSKAITNRSPAGSLSKITISGSFTTLTLALNGKVLNYTEHVDAGIVIFDNVEMEVSLNGANKFGVLNGDVDTFLSIVPGDNTLDVSGTGLNITVTIDFSPMWI